VSALKHIADCPLLWTSENLQEFGMISLAVSIVEKHPSVRGTSDLVLTTRFFTSVQNGSF
jgi:hypothetical protein